MINNFKREKLLFVSNITAMTVTFLILGMFITVIALTQTAIRNLEKQAQVTVFFKDEFPEENIKKLEMELQADTRISETRYVSKEDAFAIFSELNKEDPILLDSISASILPASLEVKTKSLDDLPTVAGELSQVDGTEEVKYFKEVIEKFRSWSKIAYTVGLTLVTLFFIVSFSVIMITTRITISSKGKELEILKLVGASDDYVKKPLVKQSLFFGLISALIASLILMAASIALQVTGAYNGLIEFSALPDFALSLTVFVTLLSFVLIVIGFTLSYIGSLTAIKKYLNY
jgi:cell division transport system permease protein